MTLKKDFTQRFRQAPSFILFFSKLFTYGCAGSSLLPVCSLYFWEQGYSLTVVVGVSLQRLLLLQSRGSRQCASPVSMGTTEARRSGLRPRVRTYTGNSLSGVYSPLPSQEHPEFCSLVVWVGLTPSSAPKALDGS